MIIRLKNIRIYSRLKLCHETNVYFTQPYLTPTVREKYFMRLNLRFVAISLILFNIIGCGSRQVRHVGCYVADVSLQGIYHGQCDKTNVAEGMGKAVGEDTYDGQFKRGLPNGQGVYIWRNGDRYIGLFQQGQANGQGVMLFAAKNCRVEGMWHDNRLVRSTLDTCR